MRERKRERDKETKRERGSETSVHTFLKTLKSSKKKIVETKVDLFFREE